MKGAIAVARSPQVAKLHTLDLHDNRIGDAGTAALAASPHLANLAELDLGRNRIGDIGAKSARDWRFQDSTEAWDVQAGPQ